MPSIRFLFLSAAVVVTVGVLRIAFPVSSAPVTSTAISKLTIYGGVITVAPGATGDNILELGNAGRDIAGSGDIFIRPGSLSGSSANFAKFSAVATKTYLTVPGSVTANGLIVTAQDATNEGGQIDLLRSSGSFHDWYIDLFTDRLRFISNGGQKFTVNEVGFAGVGPGTLATWTPGWPLEANSGTTATTANAQITATGSSGSASRSAGYNIRIDATNVWQMLNDNSPTAGGHVQNSLYFQFNGSPTNRYLAVAPGGNVYIKNSLCFGDPNTSTNCSNNWAAASTPTLDAVLSVANGNRSDQNIGLGSDSVIPAGGLVVNRGGTTGTGSAGDSIAAYANNVNSAIFAEQQNPAGYAAYFSGRTNLTFGNPGTALAVTSTGTSGPSGVGSNAIVATGGVGGPVSNSSALEARGGNATSGKTTFGVRAIAGTGTGANYAGYFQGAFTVEGSSQFFGSIGLGGASSDTRYNRTKSVWQTQVCEMWSDTCYGPYVGTKPQSGAGSTFVREEASFCYNQSSDQTIQCKKIYFNYISVASGCSATSSRDYLNGVSYYSN
ncbi:MAG: hypothetical protein HY975_02415, partial [Candidatus Kerfeldbacteria bacterium]|nr:hypothetical protein [Candidatus Kerfeldbacteria bacterium]